MTGQGAFAILQQFQKVLSETRGAVGSNLPNNLSPWEGWLILGCWSGGRELDKVITLSEINSCWDATGDLSEALTAVAMVLGHVNLLRIVALFPASIPGGFSEPPYEHLWRLIRKKLQPCEEGVKQKQ